MRQPKSGHRAGHDAMLLAAATSARSGDRVVDFGAGVGAAGLALATRVSGLEIVLIEIDEVLAELARGNAASNGIEAKIIAMDLASGAEAFAGAGLAPDSVDAVLMNPPFNDSKRHRSSPDKSRKIAHVADAATLESWIHAARRILKSGGVLTLIWRADGLARSFGGARSRLWQPCDFAGSWQCGHTRDPRAGSRDQGRTRADGALSGPDAQ